MPRVRAGQAAAGCGGRAGGSRELGWGWTGRPPGQGPAAQSAGTEAAAGPGCIRVSSALSPRSAWMCAGVVTSVQERFKSCRRAQGAGLGQLWLEEVADSY